MRKIFGALLMMLLLTACASRQAAVTLTQAQKAYAKFEKDFQELSKTSMEREWEYRTVLRELAARKDSEKPTYTGEEVSKLLAKYQQAFAKDMIRIDEQRKLHLQSLVNASIGSQLIGAVQGYHANGVTAVDVSNTVMDAIIPGVSDILSAYGVSSAESKGVK